LRVDAPAEAALAAVREATPAEMALVRTLFRVRGLPAARSRPLWEQMAAIGFRVFDERTLVAVGRPWTPWARLRSVDDFRAFADPGWAKMSMDVSFRAGVLSTETRIWLTDARSRRRFRLYWIVVRPFSGLVRRGWLRAAKRRAEAAP